MTTYLLRLLRVTLHTPIFLIVSLRSSHFLMSFVNVWLYNGSWIRVCLMPEECVLWFLWHSSTQTWEEHILVHFHFNLLSFSNLSVTHTFWLQKVNTIIIPLASYHKLYANRFSIIQSYIFIPILQGREGYIMWKMICTSTNWTCFMMIKRPFLINWCDLCV